MKKRNRSLALLWQNKIYPWLRQVMCVWDGRHVVEHWQFDESGKAQGHGKCIYCGEEVTLTSLMLGKHLDNRRAVGQFAERCSRSTCLQCGSADYTLETREDAGSMPEYLEVCKRCKRCRHTWGEMVFTPY